MAYVFCNSCGHRNPPESGFCSSCGSVLDLREDRTITLSKTDSFQDALGSADDAVVALGEIVPGQGILVVRSGSQAGNRFVLAKETTTLGRHPDSDISLDDITVSRRHVEITRTEKAYVVRDAGSLNGTYVNQTRIDKCALAQGDDLQVGKFHLVFFERAEDAT